MKKVENDLFLGNDINSFNDFDNSKEIKLNSESNINRNNDINLNDLNFNEEDELKNFVESLNHGEHPQESSDFLLSKNSPSFPNANYNIQKSNNNNNYNNLLESYIARLKNFGFPEIGAISLSDNPKEQEKTFKFFDYIILKKANNLDD